MTTTSSSRPHQTAWQFFEEEVMKPSSKGCRIWPKTKRPDGYGVINLPKEQGGPRTLRVSILTCERWHGPRPEGKEVAHSCGNPSCWAGEHLRWATRKENRADMRLHQTVVQGEGHYASKVTAAQVFKIRQQAQAGRSQTELAKEYQMSQPAISHIINRKSWAWLP